MLFPTAGFGHAINWSEILNRLEGRTAIVTGAASGIGRAIALQFAQEGARVVVADIIDAPKEGGESTEKIIADAGGEAIWMHCDISNWDDIDAMVTRTVADWGGLDIIVNNAAHWTTTRLTDTTNEQWREVMAVNSDGYFMCCKRAVQQMLTQPVRGDARGRIVNITSQHGMIGAPNDIAYGTGKASSVYLTRQIATDYGRDHIVCNAIAPGRIVTGKSGVSTEPKGLEAARIRTPYPRLGRPEDVAKAALFLASDECSFISGVNLMVDGGWSAS
jgi:NAD(P)-dependent dehydrogenase (short-subunit alcohol dehydrogenase family)